MTSIIIFFTLNSQFALRLEKSCKMIEFVFHIISQMQRVIESLAKSFFSKQRLNLLDNIKLLVSNLSISYHRS